MDYKIVEMPAFKFAGVSKRVHLQRWMSKRKIMPIVKFGCLYVRKDRKTAEIFSSLFKSNIHYSFLHLLWWDGLFHGDAQVGHI